MGNTNQDFMKESNNRRKLAKQLIWEKQIESIARQKLMDMGVKIHILGFNFLKTGIVIVLDEERKNPGDIKMMALYEAIGKKYNATPVTVERAIRHIHETRDLRKYFNVPYKISNKALLLLLANEVKESFYQINDLKEYEITPQ